MPIVLVKTARGTNAFDGAFVFHIEGENFESIVAPVCNVKFGLFVKCANPNAMAGVEKSVVLAFAPDGFYMFEVFIKAENFLTAITIYDVNIAIR